MAKRRENIMIGFLAITMLFSSVGTGLLLLAQGDGPTPRGSTTSAATAELQEAVEPLEAPEVFIPEADVTTLETTDLVEGTGAEVLPGDTLTVHYQGTLATDGTVFDSSFLRGAPATFPLSGVITGWQEGLPGMKEGGTRRLVIPSEQAYGEGGTPDGSIPPNTDLVFVVELISRTATQ